MKISDFLLKTSLRKTLKLLSNFFWLFHRNIVKKNTKFKDIHRGETCFIFANGASLKYYDISKLPSNIAIVCAYSLADNRIKSLNAKYCVIGEGYCLYSWIYNSYSHIKKIQANKIRSIFSLFFKSNPNIEFIVNITNFYASILPKKNISFIYSFGDKTNKNFDMAGNFSTNYAALEYMLGVSKYMGFSKAILIGCDYLGSPPHMGHFYCDSQPFFGKYLDDYCKKTKQLVDNLKLDILVILPKSSISQDFKFDSYESFFNLKRKERPNKEFISNFYLDLMRDASKSDQILM